jgi:hypothetical protein
MWTDCGRGVFMADCCRCHRTAVSRDAVSQQACHAFAARLFSMDFMLLCPNREMCTRIFAMRFGGAARSHALRLCANSIARTKTDCGHGLPQRLRAGIRVCI